MLRVAFACAVGRVANLARLPGVVRPFERVDAVTGQRVSVRVDPLFVVLSVVGGAFYIDRLTGRPGGTGSATC